MASYLEVARQVLATLDGAGIPEGERDRRQVDASQSAGWTAVKPTEPDLAPAALRTFGSWAEWKAAMLNQLFAEQGLAGEPGRIKPETVRRGERERRPSEAVQEQVVGMPADPRHPGKHIDSATGIWPASEWGYECQRGFVSNARFGSGPVVPRTNRASTRKWRQINAGAPDGHQ